MCNSGENLSSTTQQGVGNDDHVHESGIPAEALKALPPDGIEYVRTLLQDFWEGRRIYEEWQTTLL
jgi:hypothetical protein